jgi:RimJ/RimL family protein N-acetyltransferase
VEIRRATSAQWRESRDIRLRALADAPDAFLSTLEREQGFDEETWKSRLDRAYTVFAWEGEDVVGTATGKPDPHEDGGREIVGMWVDPAHRRSGVATALVTELVRWARAEGAGSVALWFADGNDRARRLYAECGFALTGEREAMRPGHDECRMRLPLA